MNCDPCVFSSKLTFTHNSSYSICHDKHFKAHISEVIILQIFHFISWKQLDILFQYLKPGIVKHTNGLSCLSYSRGHLIYLDIKSLSPEYIFYIVKTARRRISGVDSNGCFRNKSDIQATFRKNWIQVMKSSKGYA